MTSSNFEDQLRDYLNGIVPDYESQMHTERDYMVKFFICFNCGVDVKYTEDWLKPSKREEQLCDRCLNEQSASNTRAFIDRRYNND